MHAVDVVADGDARRIEEKGSVHAGWKREHRRGRWRFTVEVEWWSGGVVEGWGDILGQFLLALRIVEQDDLIMRAVLRAYEMALVRGASALGVISTGL